jgi:hypothetical protein
LKKEKLNEPHGYRTYSKKEIDEWKWLVFKITILKIFKKHPMANITKPNAVALLC